MKNSIPAMTMVKMLNSLMAQGADLNEYIIIVVDADKKPVMINETYVVRKADIQT